MSADSDGSFDRRGFMKFVGLSGLLGSVASLGSDSGIVQSANAEETDPQNQDECGIPLEYKGELYKAITAEQFTDNFADSFNKIIVSNVTVQLDLPSSYDATPERYKAFYNGQRVNLSDLSSQTGLTFTDGDVDFQFQVDAGNTLRFQTRERPRYVPNFDAIVSGAMQISDQLQPGDYLVFGQGEDDFSISSQTGSGWAFRFRGGKDPEFYLQFGSQQEFNKYPNEDIDITKPIRLADDHNLYNVGAHEPNYFYTDSEENENNPENYVELKPVASDDDWATGQFNLPVFWEFSIGSGNSTKTLKAGSLNYAIQGNVSLTLRLKPARNQNLQSTNGTTINTTDYTPICAVRLQPGSEDVKATLNSISLDASKSGEMLVKEFHSDEISFVNGNPNWDTPDQQTETNTAIEQSFNVDTFPNTSGTDVQQDPNPGGFTIGFVGDIASQSGSSKTGTPTATEVERPLYSDAIAVFFKRNDGSNNTGGGGIFEYETLLSF